MFSHTPPMVPSGAIPTQHDINTYKVWMVMNGRTRCMCSDEQICSYCLSTQHVRDLEGEMHHADYEKQQEADEAYLIDLLNGEFGDPEPDWTSDNPYALSLEKQRAAYEAHVRCERQRTWGAGPLPAPIVIDWSSFDDELPF